jgi:hypothetical protein
MQGHNSPSRGTPPSSVMPDPIRHPVTRCPSRGRRLALGEKVLSAHGRSPAGPRLKAGVTEYGGAPVFYGEVGGFSYSNRTLIRFVIDGVSAPVVMSHLPPSRDLILAVVATASQLSVM